MSWIGIARFCRRTIIRVLGVILLIGLTAFLYLNIQGVPRRFVDRWLGKLRSAGYCVTVERIRLDLMEGIVAEQFRAFEDEAHLRPMLEADRVALFLNPFDWFRHEVGLRRLRIHNGLLRLELVDQPTDDTEVLVLRHVNGFLRFGKDAWHLPELSADLLGIKINCCGEIRIPKTAAQPASLANQSVRGQLATPTRLRRSATPRREHLDKGGRSEPQESEGVNPKSKIENQKSKMASPAVKPGSVVTHRIGALTRSQRERILELVRQLNAITFSVPPHADITFQIDTEDPSVNEAKIQMEGAATRALGVQFDQWRLQAGLKDGQLHLSEASIQQRDQSLTCSGSYTFTNRVMDARCRGQVILKDWMILAPPAWRDALNTSGFPINGPIQCDIRLDPAPVDLALNHLHGWLALTQTDAKGIWIEKGFAGFAIRDGEVNIDPLVAILGQGNSQGSVQGHFNYAWDTGDYEGHVESSVDPHLLVSLLNSNQAEIVNALVFKNKPIACNMDFSGQASRDDSIWIGGGVQASNFTYNAVPVTLFQSQLGYANGILSFDNVRLVRPEGEVTGKFSDLVDGTVLEIDLVSTANPTAVARIIGPDVVSFLDGFHFTGPMRIAVRGRIDYGTGTLTDIKAEIDGMHWGYASILADRCSLNVAVKQLRFDLTDIRAEVYEGTLSGQASFYPVGTVTNFRYDVSARIDDVNLNTLLQSLGYQGNEEYEGLLYSECALSGMIGQGRGDTARGGGWIRIQDGQLYHLRLFGGFSRLVSILNPNLGFINLTDFSANVTIKDRKINTLDATLTGPTLAIHGEGDYAFDGGLNFIVWAQASERKTLFPRLTQATEPVLAKLLAVRLTGTLSNPKWWPLNLTKDQLLALPKDILITMPKDVLMGLPKDLLVTLPKEVLVTLPQEILITLPKEIFIDLPENVWNKLKHLRPSKANP